MLYILSFFRSKITSSEDVFELPERYFNSPYADLLEPVSKADRYLESMLAGIIPTRPDG